MKVFPFLPVRSTGLPISLALPYHMVRSPWSLDQSSGRRDKRKKVKVHLHSDCIYIRGAVGEQTFCLSNQPANLVLQSKHVAHLPMNRTSAFVTGRGNGERERGTGEMVTLLPRLSLFGVPDYTITSGMDVPQVMYTVNSLARCNGRICLPTRELVRLGRDVMR